MITQIKETFINQDKNYIYGDSGWYEPYTDNPGALYRSLQSEYGRCTGRVYIDLPNGKAKPVGWVFVKRMEYEGSRNRETYIREAWVSLRKVGSGLTA